MAIALVQQANASSGGSTDPVCSFASSPTNTRLLVAMIATSETTAASLTNPTGWDTDAEVVTGDGLVRIISKEANGDGTDVQFTDANSVAYQMWATEWSGNQQASPLDGVSAGNSSGTNVSSITPGSLTPTEPADLMIGCALLLSGGTSSVNSSYTKLSGSTRGIGAYKIKTTAAAENPTFSWGGPQHTIAIQAAFFPTTKTLAGTTGGVSSLTGALSVANFVPLAGTTGGVSSLTGALSSRAHLAGTTAGSTVVTGTLTVSTPVVVDSPTYVTGTAGQATVTGTTGRATVTGVTGMASVAGTNGTSSTDGS